MFTSSMSYFLFLWYFSYIYIFTLFFFFRDLLYIVAWKQKRLTSIFVNLRKRHLKKQRCSLFGHNEENSKNKVPKEVIWDTLNTYKSFISQVDGDKAVHFSKSFYLWIIKIVQSALPEYKNNHFHGFKAVFLLIMFVRMRIQQ